MQRTALPALSSSPPAAAVDLDEVDGADPAGGTHVEGARPALSSQASCASWASCLSTASDAALIEDEAGRLGDVGEAQAQALALDLLRDVNLSTPPASPEAAVDRFLISGDPAALPAPLRSEAEQSLRTEPADSPCSRLRAVIGALSRAVASTQRSLDARPIGRAGLNLAHGGLRNLLSVALPTMARQAIGRALDLALRQGPGEVARTVLSCVCLMLPAVGQGVLLARDERHGRATARSRFTRGVVIAQQTAVTTMGIATGTVRSLGVCVASGLLYPLMRDTVQARYPLRTDPPSGPTRVSLVASVIAYALGQLMLSRVFAAFPDAVEHGEHAGRPLVDGCVIRGLSNGVFELLDMLIVVGAQHLARHGCRSQPRVRITTDAVGQAVRTQQFWDTTTARSAHVLSIGQIYTSLSANHMLPAAMAMATALGPHRADLAADWITEAVAFCATALSYAVWTDPLHARGAVLQTLEEAHRGDDAPRQFACNREEPAVAGDAPLDGTLTRYIALDAESGPRARAPRR